MKISDVIVMCVRNLTRRKFRTFLTVVGVVIGTCAIVVMISLGIGISASQDALMENMGDLSKINVYQGWGEAVLDDDALASFLLIEGVDVVTPNESIYNMGYQAELYAGKKQRYLFDSNYYITGVYPEAMEKMGYTLLEGSYLPKSDGKKIRVVMGENAVYQFADVKKKWPNNMVNLWDVDEEGNAPEPFFQLMDEPYTLKLLAPENNKRDLEYEVEIVGVVTSSDYDVQYAIYFDMADFQRLQAEYRKEYNIKVDKNSREAAGGYSDAVVKAKSVNQVTEIQDQIIDMNFGAYSMQEWRESMQQQSQTLQMILGGLGAVSLFVAAISITNTMIMSVYERTREIGVMKVLGCLVGNIRSIFLLEAGMIGFFGGVIGIGVSYLLSFIMNRFGTSLGSSFGLIMMGEDTKFSIIPPWLVLLGISFATLIGLTSGFYPANRAVRISALEAIKTE